MSDLRRTWFRWATGSERGPDLVPAGRDNDRCPMFDEKPPKPRPPPTLIEVILAQEGAFDVRELGYSPNSAKSKICRLRREGVRIEFVRSNVYRVVRAP